jgi:tetratricopeptide (TPR) repeat protein
MSTSSELEPPEVCASCGIAATGGMTLKKCACNLVKYCNVDCQTAHRSKHKKACRMRLTEMRDESLLKQPDGSYLGECPIYCLPQSIEGKKSAMMSCCSKIICRGCCYANLKREREQGLQPRCAYCRQPVPKSIEEVNRNTMKRIKKNDPDAMAEMGKSHYGKGEYGKALEYFTKAAELGDVGAKFCLGGMYQRGLCVEKDEKKAVYHYEQAAIGGHPEARGLLALHEMDNNRFDRAAKHYIIAANLGCYVSLESVKQLFVMGIVSKEDYSATLRAHQAAVDATKSAERDEQEACQVKKHASRRS